jgi:hypothetical protein
MDGHTGVGTGVASHVGEIWDVGLPLTNQSRDDIRLDRVDILGLPNGLTYDAVLYNAEDSQGEVGLLKGDLAVEQPDKFGHPHPVKGFVLKAGADTWYVLVKFTPKATGHYKTKGIRVWYVVHGDRVHQDFAMWFTTTTK